jgi:NAD(P)-dependent dehydrogenase (short-subunit alcohol dehydrogenase family)
MNNNNGLIVITGTDSGIGQSLAQIFLEQGYTVLATYLEKPAVKKAINAKLDIRKNQDILKLGKEVCALVDGGKRLQGLINNAGIALGGPIEDLPIEIYKQNFEVNFFGLIRLTQQLLPHLIKSRGRIIIHGSAAGRVAMPFLSPYVGTKYALEGLSDCLRRELAPYGIKTILLETGGVVTPIWEKATKQDISFVSAKYLKSMELFKEKFILGKKGLTAGEAARQIFRIFKKKNPRPRYIVAKSYLRERLIRSLPAKLLDNVFQKLFNMDYK